MVFDSDLLNLPLEFAEGLSNKAAKVFVVVISIVFWVIPVIVIFITPMLIWNALAGD